MGRLLKSPSIAGPEGLVLPTGSTADRALSPAVGTIRFNTDNTRVEVYNGTDFTNITPEGFAQITKDTFTGDGSTTAYTMSRDPNSDESVIVYVGNVFQISGTNYTTSGTTITFTSAPPDTHTVVVLHGFDSTTSE